MALPFEAGIFDAVLAWRRRIGTRRSRRSWVRHDGCSARRIPDARRPAHGRRQPARDGAGVRAERHGRSLEVEDLDFDGRGRARRGGGHAAGHAGDADPEAAAPAGTRRLGDTGLARRRSAASPTVHSRRRRRTGDAGCATSAEHRAAYASAGRLGRYPPCPAIDRSRNPSGSRTVVRHRRPDVPATLPPPRRRQRAPAAGRRRHHRRQPPVVLRLGRARPGRAPAAAVRRQGRVPRPLDDAAAVPRARHDPRRAGQPPPGLRRAAGRRPRCWRPTSCSPSTPKAPARRTARCRRATTAWATSA